MLAEEIHRMRTYVRERASERASMGLFSVTAPPQPILTASSSRKFAIDAHPFSSAHSIASASRSLKFTGFSSQTSGLGDKPITSLKEYRSLIQNLPFSLSNGNQAVRVTVSVTGNVYGFKNHVQCKRGYVVGAAPKSNQVRARAVTQESQLKDDNLVFVAGATGRVGSRTVRELLKLGFCVRAGVRNPVKAEPLLQSVRQMKVDNEASVVEKLELVECDLELDRIEPAIGNASVVICCIGASEKEIFDVTGPYRIDYQATKNLIDAAAISGVKHFILLTSLGTNKIGFPAAILNLFWGVLLWKRKAEEALIKSGLPYTIVRPGGMERPTDAYKETHNIFLSKEDTLFGGQVSNLQVAELMSFMAKNRGLSYCKVVEVIAETTAPLTPMGELLAQIPSQRQDSSLLKESQTASELDSSPSKISSGAKSFVIDEPTQAEVPRSQPLSPYTTYDDLKPPTSPSPTPPSSTSVEQELSKVAAQINLSDSKAVITETKSVQVEIQERRPQSPYTVYEDLKPPTSPTPTPSSLENGAPIARYEDLKPPRSPMPSPSK
ncbi:hypothetical protein Sjap_010457 [Stephania japonica]|uniref:NAD(P)-binding domain-containing protein n=1 Tax=Stephania japonica TaxID=461633 RepID=A0AAP0P6F4_9MAGN